jgi:hypothetical protein
LKSASFIE